MSLGCSFRSRQEIASGTPIPGTSSKSRSEAPKDIPVIGQLPREWKSGPYLLAAHGAAVALHASVADAAPDARTPSAGALASVIHGTSLRFQSGLRFRSVCRTVPTASPTVQVCRGRHVPLRKRQSAAADSHLAGLSHGTRVHVPGQDDASLPLPDPNGGGRGHGAGRPPPFTWPLAVWNHLGWLRKYGAARWAQKQKALTAKRNAKARGKTKKQAGGTPAGRSDSTKKRCPAKGGAKSSARHYATDFYAKPQKAQTGHGN